MDFLWPNSGNVEQAEKVVWSTLRTALVNDEGVCYFRFPVFSTDRSRREPDFLLLHRKWGLYVIACKGYQIDNIEQIDELIWFMKNNWHSKAENPYIQAEDQMLTIVNKLHNERDLRRGRQGLIAGHTFVALPFISKAEWKAHGFDATVSYPDTIIFADDLEPGHLRARLQNVLEEERQGILTDDQWTLALSILRGSPVLRREPRPDNNKPDTKASKLRQVEQQMQVIDREQHRIAVQVPDGPQRIRGLAGSGKTVVMCMKAAEMHLRHPDWEIAYTFYTRSLYGQIKSLITRFFQYWNGDDGRTEPDWKRLRILHGWGGRGASGLYSTVAKTIGREPRTYQEARNIFLHKEQSELLGQCCRELLKGDEVHCLFDAILIDEAQDFHFDFYKLCYHILRKPKRLVWAYDEVQSLESLSIPTTIDIFGTAPDGSPLIDLEGTYPDGEIEKDLILHRCYRTPRPILVAAHLFGMGLLRPKGAVQFIPTQGGWEDIGYEVISGKFEPGQKVTIRRPEDNSPHLLEKLAGYKELVNFRVFDARSQELEWIAQQVKNNIFEDQLRPEEIAIVSLDWRNMKNDFIVLQEKLKQLQIQALITGDSADKESFQEKGKVTLAGIFKAKGNEASVVYVMGFDQVDSNPKEIVQSRNQAFTAMTRARGWCVLTGLGERAKLLFTEIENILVQDPEQITFIVPDPSTIRRNLDNLEYEKRRNRIKKAHTLANQLSQILAQIDDTNVKNEIIKKLRTSEMDNE